MNRLERRLKTIAVEIRKKLSPREIIGFAQVGEINELEAGKVEAKVLLRDYTYGALCDIRLLDPGRCQSLYCDGSDLRQGQWLQIVRQTTFGFFSGFPMPVSFRTIFARPLRENSLNNVDLYNDPGFRACMVR